MSCLVRDAGDRPPRHLLPTVAIYNPACATHMRRLAPPVRCRRLLSSGPRIVTLTNERVAVGLPSRTLVEDLSLTIREGERWAILGVNGCGKSTLAKRLGARLTGCADDEVPQAICLDAVPPGGSAVAYASISFDSHAWLL